MVFHMKTGQIFLLIFAAFLLLSLSHGASQSYHPPNILTPVRIEEGKVITWGARRSVLDGNQGEFVENKSMILAAKRTHRKDPMKNFRYYNGGWNISNKHYFSSVAYTAAPLFFAAVIWFIGFFATLLIICIGHCCCQLKNCGYSQTTYAYSLAFLVFFAVAVAVGCIVLYAGEEKFHTSTTRTLNYVANQADTTVENLTTVSDSLSVAKDIGVDQIYLPPNVQNNINKVKNMIDASAATLEKETNGNKNNIRHILDVVRLILIAVAAVMLLLAFLGLLFSIFGMQLFVYIVAKVGWILATIALVLCCLFLILHNVVGDTCVAMDDWVQNPTAHTTLDDILPCMDNATAQEALSQSKDVSFQLSRIVNFFIANVSNVEPPRDLPPGLRTKATRLYYNQSGPLVPVLCNPFNSDLTDRVCAAGEVNFNNASQVWSKYICQVSENGNCTTTGRLTPEFYNQIMFGANVSYTLHRYGPFLVGLVDCTFVRETFSGITRDHCGGLKRYSEWIFIGLLVVSIATMLLLVSWVFHVRERRRRTYAIAVINNKQFVNLSAAQEPSLTKEQDGVL